MARAVGIDLGTTNSVVAVLEGGEPTVLALAKLLTGYWTAGSIAMGTLPGAPSRDAPTSSSFLGRRSRFGLDAHARQ